MDIENRDNKSSGGDYDEDEFEAGSPRPSQPAQILSKNEKLSPRSKIVGIEKVRSSNGAVSAANSSYSNQFAGYNPNPSAPFKGRTQPLSFERDIEASGETQLQANHQEELGSNVEYKSGTVNIRPSYQSTPKRDSGAKTQKKPNSVALIHDLNSNK